LFNKNDEFYTSGSHSSQYSYNIKMKKIKKYRDINFKLSYENKIYQLYEKK